MWRGETGSCHSWVTLIVSDSDCAEEAIQGSALLTQESLWNLTMNTSFYGLLVLTYREQHDEQ